MYISPIREQHILLLSSTGRVHTGQGKVRENFYFLKVREKSVNFEFDIKSGNFEFDIKSGRSQGILIYSLPNKHSTYDYGSLLKIVRKKDRKNLIDYPYFFSFIFILLLIAFIYF